MQTPGFSPTHSGVAPGFCIFNRHFWRLGCGHKNTGSLRRGTELAHFGEWYAEVKGVAIEGEGDILALGNRWADVEGSGGGGGGVANYFGPNPSRLVRSTERRRV